MEEVIQLIQGIPICTRMYLCLCIGIAIATTYELIEPLDLYFSPRIVFEGGEWWRCFTCLCFIDQISLNLMFQIHFIYTFFCKIEEHFYYERLGQFLYYLFKLGVIVIAIGTYYGTGVFFSNSFVSAVLYTWSRRYPHEHIALFGLIPMKAPYMPYFVIAFYYFQGGLHVAISEIIGLAAGHIVWYLEDVVPKVTGFDPMLPPAALRRWIFG
eukprot:Tbor_TRINITY_DN1451_c0_g1::TRINITY_DN1451_c0_g1_i1::g.623::m.623/K13989/DERL2_3; Derlin-2/3